MFRLSSQATNSTCFLALSGLIVCWVEQESMLILFVGPLNFYAHRYMNPDYSIEKNGLTFFRNHAPLSGPSKRCASPLTF